MDGWAAYASRDYNRLGFFLMGSIESHVVLALDGMPGSGSIPAFPNASDVIIIGCPEDNYVDALAVVLLDKAHEVLVSSVLPTVTSGDQAATSKPVCPLLHP
jgi:hypothetical protein